MANSLAAGFMLGASLGLCYEGASYGIEPTALGVLAGCVFLLVSGRVIGRIANCTSARSRGRTLGRHCSSSGS